MNAPSQPTASARRMTIAFLSAVIGVAFVGFFVGINHGVPHDEHAGVVSWLAPEGIHVDHPASVSVVPAVKYSEMRRRETGPTSKWKPTLGMIPQPKYDLFAEITPSPEQKRQSTLVRASRRAFNGAPPIIPHAIEGTTDSACYACHGQGMRIGERVANRMSHGFLANCVQCHAPPPPHPFSDAKTEVDNTFAGLPAPLKGERAFPGAPPTIPHSTWMRETCLACHGGEAGWAGLESTHPWRVNCQQCHAPSALLEQAPAPSEIGFLPEPQVQSP